MTDISTIVNLDPQIVAIIILALIAGCQLIIIIKAGNILRSYAKMMVMKTRITSDGTITLADADILKFVQETIDLMNELESLFHYITGYILNHPSTGWIKGYAPKIQAVGQAVIEQIAKEEKPEPTSEQIKPEY